MLPENTSALLLLLVTVRSFSQRDVDVQDIFKINIAAPALAFEKRIGKFQTINAQVFVRADWGIGYASSIGNTSFFYASPAAGLHYRYYYNAVRRQAGGKRTAMNSMNYLGPLYTIAFSSRSISSSYQGEYNRRPVHTAVLAWGIQRNYTRRFSLDCNAGVGIDFANTSLYNQNDDVIDKNIVAAFTYSLQIRMGWWLGRKNG